MHVLAVTVVSVLVLVDFGRQNPGEETELVERLPQMWEDLVLKSKNIDAGLTRVKKKFTEVRSDADECMKRHRPMRLPMSVNVRRSCYVSIFISILKTYCRDIICF